jgi:hypothetical protein
MLQAIENFQGAYLANIGGVRGVVLQFEDFTPADLRRSIPDRGCVEDGRIFVPQFAISEVIAALVAQMKALENLQGKDVLGQAMDDLGPE